MKDPTFHIDETAKTNQLCCANDQPPRAYKLKNLQKKAHSENRDNNNSSKSLV